MHVTYLESHVGLLSRSDVLSALGDSDHGDVVIVSSEEVLLPGDDVTDDDGGSEWEDDVFVVWVEDKSGVDFAYSYDKMLGEAQNVGSKQSGVSNTYLGSQ